VEARVRTRFEQIGHTREWMKLCEKRRGSDKGCEFAPIRGERFAPWLIRIWMYTKVVPAEEELCGITPSRSRRFLLC